MAAAKKAHSYLKVQECLVVAGKPRDDAVHFDIQCAVLPRDATQSGAAMTSHQSVCDDEVLWSRRGTFGKYYTMG